MFMGHFAPAFVLARPDRKAATPLWQLFLAGQLVDIGFCLLVALGVEGLHILPGQRGFLALELGPMPWTHSLLMTAIWGALVTAMLTWARLPGAAALGLAVFLHWPLDALVHRPDLALAPGSSARVGLSLWSYPVLALAVEVALIVGFGVVYRARVASTARQRAVVRLLVAMVLVQAVVALAPVDPPQSTGLGLLAMLLAIAAFTLGAASVEGRLAREPTPAKQS